ncbi:general stress protein 26 [Nocardia transvalensis]|uniref:General stress protein 26 n=1 Tax=Nocardia transvalensis TaxID=37333 RepID=A0A7W9PGW5_9NOCA|nr:pyridoxamine 5'-phosphate oxidase family protein [Nocardia transvalensis]MBB5915700.1 general stress protein 26 [Nocardia transvalensis]
MAAESTTTDSEICREFVRIAHTIVWCTLTTVDSHGSPRSRVVHPYWESSGDGVVGWVFTRPGSLTVKHVARNPHISCSYWSPSHETAVADCRAQVVDDEYTRAKVWSVFATAPEPLGYDPRILGADDHHSPAITVLRMVPHRLRVPSGLWRRSPHVTRGRPGGHGGPS